MAKHPGLDIRVAYCSLQGAEPGLDPEFGIEIKSDRPLLEGYPWVFVPNCSLRPGLRRFFGLHQSGFVESDTKRKLRRCRRIYGLYVRKFLDYSSSGKGLS